MIGQTFAKAPAGKLPVKQIVEWTTFAEDGDEPAETIKDAVYVFRKDGQLQQWISNNADNEVFEYSYDEKKRLNKITIKNGKMSRTVSNQYFEDRRMAEIQVQDSDVRSVQYFNKKGQVTEEKSFFRNEGSNGWATMERTVYSYNKQDSLTGEMRYVPASAGHVNQFKTIHSYGKNSNKKSDIVYFEADGKPYKKITFRYDDQRRLKEEKMEMVRTGETTIKEHIYRDGEIWQIITKGKNYRNEKIYKEGRLVRSKEYDKAGKLIWYTDYQYVY